MILHQTIESNQVGRDFVVGDIHGCYSELMEKLAEFNFDTNKDRLFAVGDLIDRGTENEKVLSLLREDWFFSVYGNHEDMFLGRFYYQDQYDAARHRMFGGEWADDLTEDQIENFVMLVKQLPWAITIESEKGSIGIVHAEVKSDDWACQQSLRKPWDGSIWNKFKVDAFMEGESFSAVRNIERVVSGHVACETPVIIANHWYIDTRYLGGELTVMTINQLFE
jgi:serine/threonine protein phosphatase 1